MKKVLILIMLIAIFPVTGYSEDSSTSNGMSIADIYKNVRSGLKSAPAGFSWDLYRNAISLKPVGWFVHDKIQYNGFISATHAMSPVDFSGKNKFETGLTVGIFTNLKKYRKPEPSKAALIMIGMELKKHSKKDIMYLSQDKKGDFNLYWIRYKEEPPGQTPIIVHQFYIANDVTDNLNCFIFESPEDKWEENWKKYGEVILKNVSVIPVYPND